MYWRRATIVVLAGGIVCLVFFLLPRRDPVRHVLPDGSAITLLTVKAGAQHFAPMASFKQQLAARLPASWNQRLKLSPPPSTYCQFSPSNYLSVWLLVEIAPGRLNFIPSTGPPQFDLLLGDDDGSFTCNAEHHGRVVSVPLGPGRWLVGLPVAAWPRRPEFITIHVYSKWGDPFFSRPTKAIA